MSVCVLVCEWVYGCECIGMCYYGCRVYGCMVLVYGCRCGCMGVGVGVWVLMIGSINLGVWVLVSGCGTRYIGEGVWICMNVGIWVWL